MTGAQLPGRNEPIVSDDGVWDNENITALDVIDALRLVITSQPMHDERSKLVGTLLEFAPDTTGEGRGAELLMRLVSEGTLAVQLRP